MACAFAATGAPALVLFSVIAILILAAMLWKIDRLDSLSATGLALIFGGAAGNVYDRVRVGAVTDFLDFYVRSYHCMFSIWRIRRSAWVPDY